MPNPYPTNFTDLIVPGEVCLDLGAGGRKLPGVLCMDLFTGDVQGDCLALPFRDSCADLILSQAVLEHVTHPQQAVDEMLRVLKPGGLLYVGAAFMQPVHMAPHHYFNITPYGLEYLLRAWDIVWTAPVGTTHEVLSWISRVYNIPYRKAGSRSVSAEKYARASCGVSALARKPVE